MVSSGGSRSLFSEKTVGEKRDVIAKRRNSLIAIGVRGLVVLIIKSSFKLYEPRGANPGFCKNAKSESFQIPAGILQNSVCCKKGEVGVGRCPLGFGGCIAALWASAVPAPAAAAASAAAAAA